MTDRALKLNNKGMSLIELIVAVLIMGIVSTALILNISQIYGRNARDAAEKYSKVLDSARLEAMNKVSDEVSVRLTISGNDIVATLVYGPATGTTDGDTTVIGNTGLKVTIMQFLDELNGTEKELGVLGTDYNELVLSFDKSTGAYKSAKSDKGDISVKIAGVKFEAMKKAETVLIWDTGRSYSAPLD